MEIDLKARQIQFVSKISTKLCTVLNVEDEQLFLQQCMSPAVVQECIQSGQTNLARVETFCEKMIEEIRASGSQKMYDTLCQYFLNRSETYQSMYQQFTAVVSVTNDNSSSNLNASAKKGRQLVNSDRKSKYKQFGNGAPIANGRYSEIYLLQRKSDGVLFIMKRYTQDLSKSVRDAQLFQVTYMIEYIMSQPHPCILHFVECFFDSEERLCVVMEQCVEEKLGWLIKNRKDEWFPEYDMKTWISQICLAEEHIEYLEQQLNIKILYGIDDIYLKLNSTGNREVKIRIHPLPLCKDFSRVTTIRQSNLLSIFSQLLPKTFKDADNFSLAFKRFSEDFHNQKFPTLLKLSENTYLKEAILEATTALLQGKLTSQSRFIYIATIGQGSFGKVDKMWDGEQKVMCAVKKIPNFVMSPENVMVEIEVMKQCEHKRIVRLIERFRAECDQFWIVMEYCDGGNLHNRIKAQGGGAFSYQHVSVYFQQILDAVKYLHEETKYFHGDIKPQNVFVYKFKVNLGDFGEAHLLSRNQSVMTTFRKIGTPRYMALEIFEFHPCGKRADLWSLGCLLYELVALVPAFNDKNETEMIERIKRAEYLPIPYHIPTSMSEMFIPLIKVLMQINPQQRMNLRAAADGLPHTKGFMNTRDTESRRLWYDGHAPLCELHPGTYPLIPWDSSISSSANPIVKLALMKQFDTRGAPRPTVLWLRIRLQNEDWIVEYSDQSYGKYILNAISLTLNFHHNNVRKEAKGMFHGKEWSEVFRFQNISQTPTYIQVTLGSECCDRTLGESELMQSKIVESYLGFYSSEINVDNWSAMCHQIEGDRFYRTKLQYHMPCLDHSFPVTFSLYRAHNNVWMNVKSHCECPRFLLIQVECVDGNMDGSENEINKTQLVEFAQITQAKPNNFLCIEDIFASALQPLVPPKVNINVKLPEVEVSFFWHGYSPVTPIREENRFRHVQDLDMLRFIAWMDKYDDWVWLPAILLGDCHRVIVIGLKYDQSHRTDFETPMKVSLNVSFHPQVPQDSTPINVHIGFELYVNWRGEEMNFLRAEQSVLITHDLCSLQCAVEPVIRDNFTGRCNFVSVISSPQAVISLCLDQNDSSRCCK